mgnify:CR=1 FL=1
MARKTTARDVAEAAGVSSATVDRVLNGRGGVSPELEQRVIEWARKLNLDRALSMRSARTLRIAVLIQPPANPFHARVQAEFVAAQRELGRLNMQARIYHIAPNAPARIAARIRGLTPGHDALVISSVDHPDVAAACRDFGLKGPVVTLATDIEASGRIGYIGPDNRRAGRVAGDLMGRFLGPGGGDVVMLAGVLSMRGQVERAEGFRAVLRERYPGCRPVAVLESLEQAHRAGALVRGALKRWPGLKGIYVATSGTREAVRALDAAARREVVLIAHELTEERRGLLKAGRIDAIIDQNPEAEVRGAIDLLAEAFGRTDRTARPAPPMIQIHTTENS